MGSEDRLNTINVVGIKSFYEQFPFDFYLKERSPKPEFNMDGYMPKRLCGFRIYNKDCNCFQTFVAKIR